MRREMLDVRADRNLFRQLLATGQAWDLERGGLYDARSGAINIWCSPHDKPACWDRPISKGGLRHPREYVGGLSWEWQDDEQADLYVEAAPYALIDQRRREPLTERDWQEILSWLREKALGLVRLARLEPQVVGVGCPFCSFVLPVEDLLNELLTHIGAAHPDANMRGIVLGEAIVLQTDRGEFTLQSSNFTLRSFNPALKRAGILQERTQACNPKARFHDLRHTCATLLLLEDVNAKVVSERLGHARIEITINIYSHVLPTLQERAAEKLEGVMDR